MKAPELDADEDVGGAGKIKIEFPPDHLIPAMIGRQFSVWHSAAMDTFGKTCVSLCACVRARPCAC